jgi:hypothetical protein
MVKMRLEGVCLMGHTLVFKKHATEELHGYLRMAGLIQFFKKETIPI